MNEAAEYYREALKLGQKARRTDVAQGRHPFLPALDSFLNSAQMGRTQSLGLVPIPLDAVVGTKTAGRTQAFANNFMPLLEEKSEFADKWKRLCQSHLEEGIRDPIKVYEYLNRYYVQEGNKRVSVLKFFGAVNIMAEVTRVLPERTGDPEIETYYEYVDFHRRSGVNFLECSKPGSYNDLQKLCGKAPDERWTEEERTAFSSVYYSFQRAYEANGGKRLTSTVGDALLAYLRVYGYASLQGKSFSEIKKLVANVWEEIILQQEAVPIDVKLTPTAEKAAPPPFVKAILGGDKLHRVAFIHDKTEETSGWTRSHEAGRKYVQSVMEGKIVTRAYFCHMAEDMDDLITLAIQEGNDIIFTTSPVLLPASLRAAVEHPEVTILNCSLNQSHRYIRTYYARMYEAKFIIGAIAGSLAGSNNVGYICDYPIYGQIAGINAFALGVEMVNPRARVHLEWSGIDSVEDATARLRQKGISLISSQDMRKLSAGARSSFGLSLVNDDGQVTLAMPTWQWGIYYESMIRRIIDHSFLIEYQSSTKALNYFWGMSAGVVGLHCAETLPDGTRKLARVLQKSVCSGLCDPFRGPIYAKGGRELGKAHTSLTQEQITGMDWLVENIVGEIPVYEQLTPTGKAVVDVVGVERNAGGLL